MAKMNVFIHDMEAEIALGDTMNRPAFVSEAGSLKKFDILSNLFEKGRPKNFLPESTIQKAYEIYKDWKEEGISKIITKEEAQRNDYNLSPSRYISQNNNEEILTLEEAIVALEEAEEERKETEKKLQEMLKKFKALNYE